MSIYKNVASQKIAVYAVDANGDPVTGDAANITAQIGIDWGTPAATNDANPTEYESTDFPGWYLFDLTQTETNAAVIALAPVSATDGVYLEPIIVSTRPLPSHTTGSVQTDGSNAATTFKTDLSETTDDHWKDAFLLLTSGSLAGQVRQVTGYNGTTKFITVDAFTGTPADGVTFVLINR